jgi:hypothetical protein
MITPEMIREFNISPRSGGSKSPKEFKPLKDSDINLNYGSLERTVIKRKENIYNDIEAYPYEKRFNTITPRNIEPIREAGSTVFPSPSVLMATKHQKLNNSTVNPTASQINIIL